MFKGLKSMAKSTGNTGNLKPWGKGVSGNPSGRPKTPQVLKDNLEVAAKKLVKLLSSDDEKIQLSAAKDILDRVLGKAPQALEHTGEISVSQTVDRAMPETPEQWLARIQAENAINN